MEAKQMDYNSPRWLAKRKHIMLRDQYWCRECKRYGRGREATTVHHIIPVEYFPEYGFTDWNLISLCSECHNEMHDRDSHRLTDKGWALLERTATKNGQTIRDELKNKLSPDRKKKRREPWKGSRY